LFSVYTISLALLLPASPSVEELIHQPLAEVLKLTAPYDSADVHAVRARIERERDEANQSSEKLEEEWKRQLAGTRRTLRELNRTASADTEAAALRRSRLHVEIAALERSIRESKTDRERAAKTYDLQLTKLWLAERWPQRRMVIQQRVRQGEARKRRYGDVEDAGYRVIIKNPEQDIEIGQQAARQILAGGKLPRELPDDEVQRFIRKVAERVAMNSDLKVPLYVTVLDSGELRAIALPGGFLYITSGVLTEAQSESELAGVVSREIARIAARHAVRANRVSWISRMFLPVTQIVGGIFAGGPANPAAYYGIGYGLEGLGGIVGRALNSNNEGLQIEADQLGVQYAWKAGYDPAGFLSFLDSIAPRESEFLPEAPPLRERVLQLFEEIEHLPVKPATVIAAGDFDRIRRRLAR